jgi:hypothetical protein
LAPTVDEKKTFDADGNETPQILGRLIREVLASKWDTRLGDLDVRTQFAKYACQ